MKAGSENPGALDRARRDELMRNAEDHPNPEAIASLLGGETGPHEARLRRHLMSCRRCFALYAEMAESNLTWRWMSIEQSVPADWLRAAKGLTGSGDGSGRADERPGDHQPLLLRARRVPRRLMTAAAWLVAGGAVAFLTIRVLLPSPNARGLEAVRMAVSESSRIGMILTADVAPSRRPSGALPPRSAGPSCPRPSTVSRA